jgi:hypothetical protein
MRPLVNPARHAGEAATHAEIRGIPLPVGTRAPECEHPAQRLERPGGGNPGHGGQVVAVGKGKVLEDGKIQKLDVKKGDRVLFSKYAGTEITLEGEERLILREDDVLGIVE